jgi:BirA family transcriptional regulator, biotin operon repressor / biotin---[acetyl-CoA-carboxylase] ligase
MGIACMSPAVAGRQFRLVRGIHKLAESTRKERMRQRRWPFRANDLAETELPCILGPVDASEQSSSNGATRDALSAETITRALTTRRLGHPTLFFTRVGSTNDIAAHHATSGAVEGLLVVADEQTAGRGRWGRSWWAPPGSSLLFSIVLRPHLALRLVGQVTMCLGIGVVEGIAEVVSLQATLKWPNDVLLDGRKLGGMLTELRSEDGRIEYVVLGLGLNVNVESFIPAELGYSAASLAMVLGRSVSRVALLAAILAHCEMWYERLMAGTPPDRAWAAHLDTLGRTITVVTPSGVLRGLARDVSHEGALLVQDEFGKTHTIWSGDVTTARDS